MRPPLEMASGLAAVLPGVVAVRELEAQAVERLARGEWTSYAIGTRPAFEIGTRHAAGAPAGDGRDPRATARQ